MQYLLYYVVCFKVRGTTREVFVVDAMDTSLANCKVFTQWYAHDAEVALAQYMRANGIPSPFDSAIAYPSLFNAHEIPLLGYIIKPLGSITYLKSSRGVLHCPNKT